MKKNEKKHKNSEKMLKKHENLRSYRFIQRFHGMVRKKTVQRITAFRNASQNFVNGFPRGSKWLLILPFFAEYTDLKAFEPVFLKRECIYCWIAPH